jgi:hypothetical protein
MEPTKYRITARKTIIDPVERKRRLEKLYSIFEPKRNKPVDTVPPKAKEPEVDPDSQTPD